MVSTQPPTSVDIPFEADRHRVDLGAVQLVVEEHGSGEPVLLIHAALLADWFSPLLAQSKLRERYRLCLLDYVVLAGSSSATPSSNHAATDPPPRPPREVHITYAALL